MKLFSVYNRIILIATTIIFLLAAAAFYFTIHYIFVNQIDNDLKIEQHEIKTFVERHNALPETIEAKDQETNFAQTEKAINKPVFKTIQSGEHKKERYRELVFSVKANNILYTATVKKSLENTEDLIDSISLISFFTILIILITLIVTNRILLKKLWKPFYKTLGSLQSLLITQQQSFSLAKTNIDEFNFMNNAIEKAANKAQHDYLSLKEFTENASHELQTPLAIIRSKLDLLIQDANLSQSQSETIQGAYTAVEKLNRLNQSLLLLAKIENNQFAENAQINFLLKIEEKIDDFKELWQHENITIETVLQPAFVDMNNALADILLNNLFSNAMHYNKKNGIIKIELSSSFLKISNTGDTNALDKNRLFKRFYKSEKHAVHNGLGLSIIKQICDVSGFSVEYIFDNNLHVFTVLFNTSL